MVYGARQISAISRMRRCRSSSVSASAISAHRRKLDRLAQLRVALAADGFQPGNSHSGLLHLIDGPSGLDRVMLMLVADEDDALDPGLARFA